MLLIAVMTADAQSLVKGGQFMDLLLPTEGSVAVTASLSSKVHQHADAVNPMNAQGFNEANAHIHLGWIANPAERLGYTAERP